MNTYKIRDYAIILIPILLFGVLSSCKQPPTMSYNNNVDPKSDSYRPTIPQNVVVEPRNRYGDQNLLRIKWEVPKSERYINVFKVYRSDIDSSNFKLIGQVPFDPISRNSDGDNYRIALNDKEAFNGIEAWYKVKSVYYREKDTLYSTSESTVYTSNKFRISGFFFPFEDDPKIEFRVSTQDIIFDQIELYLKEKDRDPVEFGSISANETFKQYPLDIELDTTATYLYKIRLDNAETELKPIERKVIKASPPLILNTSTFENGIAELHFGAKTDSSRIISGVNFDSFQVTISEIGTDTSIIVQDSEIPFQKPYTSYTLPISESKSYLFKTKGKRGQYVTDEKKELLTYDFNINDIEGLNTPSFINHLPNGSFDANSEKVVIADQEVNPEVFDIARERKDHQFDFGINEFDDTYEIITADFASYGNYGEVILTSNSADHVKVWDSDTYRLLETIPNYREGIAGANPTFPVDFEVISDSEILIAYVYFANNSNERVSNLNLTIWNVDNSKHNNIISIISSEVYSSNIKVSSSDTHHYLFYAYGQNSTKLFIFDANDPSIKRELDTSQYLSAWRENNLKVANNGKDLYLFNKDNIVKLDAHSLDHIQTNDISFTTNWGEMRAFSAASEGKLACQGGVQYGSYSPYVSGIECSSKSLHDHNIIQEYNIGGYLTGLILNDEGDRLAAFFNDKITIYDFKESWIVVKQ